MEFSRLTMTLVIKVEDPRNEDMTRLLQAHLDFCYSSSPPESVYALDVEKLVSPAITIFGARIDGALVDQGVGFRPCGVEVHAHSQPSLAGGKGSAERWFLICWGWPSREEFPE